MPNELRDHMGSITKLSDLIIHVLGFCELAEISLRLCILRLRRTSIMIHILEPCCCPETKRWVFFNSFEGQDNLTFVEFV